MIDLEKIAATPKPTVELLNTYFPAERIGPVWNLGEDGEYVLPDKTLGWHILSWIRANLINFNDDNPMDLTPEQSRFILWFYALNDKGRFAYRAATLQRLKGWGKDPLSAILCVVELVGPCRYTGRDTDDGIPIGASHPNAWVGLGAVNLEQTRNTRSLFEKIVPGRTREKYGMEIMSEIILARQGKARLHAYGSNFKSIEGVRFTFFLLNETQHWTKSNRLLAVYETVRGNVAKDPTGGHYLCITNAYLPGEESVAEQIRVAQEKVWAGLAEDDETLYDSLEAHPSVPLDSRWAPLVLEQIRGDASWISWDNVRAEVLSGNMSASRKRRMWYNQIVTSEEALFTPAELTNATAPDMTGKRSDLQPGDEITLGFDGGRTDDATALVAMRLSDRCIIPIAVWQKPDGIDSWSVDTARVNSVVHWAFTQYDVKAFYADVNLWESFINEWSDNYRERLQIKATANSAIGFDMRGHRKRVADNNQEFVSSIRDGALFTNGSSTLRQHMLNAEARFDNFGLKFGKTGGRESGRKIDCLIAATLAYMAYRDLQERKTKDPKKVYRGTLLKA